MQEVWIVSSILVYLWYNMFTWIIPLLIVLICLPVVSIVWSCVVIVVVIKCTRWLWHQKRFLLDYWRRLFDWRWLDHVDFVWFKHFWQFLTMDSAVVTGERHFCVANIITSWTVELNKLMTSLMFDSIRAGSEFHLATGNAASVRLFTSVNSFVIA